MKIKEQIGKIIVALVLFSAFMVPTTIKFVHLFEGHDHTIVICKNHSKSHIHKHETKCEICCNFFTPLNYEASKNTSKEVYATIIVKSEENFAPLQLHSFKITNTQLRAPPIYS